MAQAPVKPSIVESELANLAYFTEDYPPMNFIAQDKAAGASVEILQLMWQEMAISRSDIAILPWARAYRIVLTTPNTMLFTMSRTSNRENLFKWVGPIISTSHILLARKDSKIKFSHLGEAFDYRVATIKDDISELSLLNQGFPVINMQKLTTLSQAIRMVDAKRVDMMLLTDDALPSLLQKHQLKREDFEVVFEVNKVDSYFAFNRQVSDQVIHQFQKAFDAIAKQREGILKKYQLIH